MEKTMNFTAFERNLQGTGASRRLRISGKVPGIVFGAGEPKMIELDHNALYFALKKEAFHSSILSMELAGTTQRVLLRDFQMHPWKQQVLHVDFQRVDDTTRLRKKVPLHFSGEEESVAVKTDKCLVAHVSTEVEIGQAFIDKLLAAHVRGDDIVTEVSMAKFWTTDLQKRLTSECLQLHGGYGFMSEYAISGDYADAAVQSIYAGSNEIQRNIIAKMSLGL
jgi:ribosomal protein bL25 (Ctc-form)